MREKKGFSACVEYGCWSDRSGVELSERRSGERKEQSWAKERTLRRDPEIEIHSAARDAATTERTLSCSPLVHPARNAHQTETLFCIAHCAFFAPSAFASLLTLISDNALRPIHAVHTLSPTKYFIVGSNFNPTQYVMISPSSAATEMTNSARLIVGVAKLGEMMANWS